MASRDTSRGTRERISRRRFVTWTAATAAAVTVVPRRVLGGAGNQPPSETLNIAGVGVGGKGFH
ncbi:MAG: gfo/Idh/MocA family oxidoreductase, partial [Planctomycetota bacterium]|nr:gfo/Idh/MocA family oxidoreductase [Planctomycetota bacterium]